MLRDLTMVMDNVNGKTLASCSETGQQYSESPIVKASVAPRSFNTGSHQIFSSDESYGAPILRVLKLEIVRWLRSDKCGHLFTVGIHSYFE